MKDFKVSKNDAKGFEEISAAISDNLSEIPEMILEGINLYEIEIEI